MKLRLKDNAVVKYFKSNVIESYAGHIIPTKIVVDIPSNNYTLTLIQTDDCIVGNGFVNWGDGEITNLNNIRSHVYKNVGKYTIEGQFIFVGELHSSMQDTLIYIQYLSNKHNGRSFDEIFNQCTKLEHVSQKRCKIAPISMVNTFKSSELLKKTTYIESCWNLNNVTNMHNSFYNCYNLVGPILVGPNVTNFSATYAYCNNLTGSPVCGPNVTDMWATYFECHNLTGSPVCGPNVNNMRYTYHNCHNLTGSPVCGPNVTEMGSAYTNCYNLTGSPVCGPNVIHMDWTYANCNNLTGSPVCGPNVVSMWYTYNGCTNLTGSPVCGPKVNFFTWAYCGCCNITGSPVCGNLVTSLQETYNGCANLTGSPVCGPNVGSMALTYTNCYNLTGSPVCGNKVQTMYGTYWNCRNLTGKPVCGNNVVNMCQTYGFCTNLKGPALVGPNVTDVTTSYRSCRNITQNAYVFSNIISKSTGCFQGKDNSKRLDIYVHKNSATLNNFLNTDNTSLVGSDITWAQNGDMYYNTPYNIYIYPVDSVEEKYMENESGFIVSYVSTESHKDYDPYSIQGLTNGYNRTVVDLGNGQYRISLFTNDTNDIVTSLSFARSTCLTDIIKLSDDINSLQSTFSECINLTGDPITSDNITNMRNTYYGCTNLTGSPVCGNDVVNMRSTYWNCHNITGDPVCGPNVNDMSGAYIACFNLTGNPVCGDKVVYMNTAYHNCYNITGQPVCGPNVNRFEGAYNGCHNLTGYPVCGNLVTNMDSVYRNCYNLTGNPVCGPNITDMVNTYHDCYNLTGEPVCGDKVTNMYYTYRNCYKISGNPTCGPNVTNMCATYMNCYNLTGEPVCEDKVTDMYYTYNNCQRLTGNPVCGNNVTIMLGTYYNCRNLTGNPVCGPNVNRFDEAFWYCTNLTGDPVCGNNVTNMVNTYGDCYNLTGPAIIGPNVTNAVGSYLNCYNIGANAYIYANECYVSNCFKGKYNDRRLNIYVHKNTNTLNRCLDTSISTSIIGKNVTWTQSGEMYYNTAYNVYIYPVDSVGDTYEEHKNKPVLVYEATSSDITPNTQGLESGYRINSSVINEGTITPTPTQLIITADQHNAENPPSTSTIVPDFNINSFKISNERMFNTNSTNGNARIGIDYYYSIEIQMDSSRINDYKLLYKNVLYSIAYVENDTWHYYELPDDIYNSFYIMSHTEDLGYFVYLSQNDGSDGLTDDLYLIDAGSDRLVKNKIIKKSDNDSLTAFDFTDINDSIGIRHIEYIDDSVVNMSNAFRRSTITGNILCGNNVQDMSDCYAYCLNISCNPVCGDKVINMVNTYYSCTNLTGSPVCGNNVKDMYQTYYNCINLTGSPACGPNVINMVNTYHECINITGQPVCGNNVVNMTEAYVNCYKLSGSAACGPNVTNMRYTYYNCTNLTGNPVCGNNVKDMSLSYGHCINLTGNPVCGDNVTNMYRTYYDCINLTGNPVCGPNVTNMCSTYEGAINCHYGNMIMYSNNVSNMYRCFNNKSGSSRLNIYVQRNSTSLNSCLVNNTRSMVSANISWTQSGNMYYNTSRNIYIYPVDDVSAIGNEVLMYSAKSANVRPTTEGLTSGYSAKTDTIKSSTVTPTPTQLIVSQAQHSSGNIPEYSTIVNSVNEIIDEVGIMNTEENGINPRVGVSGVYEVILQSIDRNRVGDYKLYINGVLYSSSTSDNEYFSFYLPGDYMWYNFTISLYHSDKVVFYYDFDQMSWSEYDLPGDMYLVDCGTNGDYDLTISKKKKSETMNAFKFEDINSKAAITDVTYISDEVTNMSGAFHGCAELACNPLCSNSVINMSNTYNSCGKLIGSPVCGSNVTDMSGAYYSCTNLTGSAVCGNKVINMSNAYYSCYSLTGSPACGPNVTNMTNAYAECMKLTGSPVCGNSVIDMTNAYSYCRNMRGNAVCGPNVNNMSNAYANCSNLTGSAACGPNVTDMSWAYFQASNITTAVCGPKVTNMYSTYEYTDVRGNMYMYSNNVSNMYQCFTGRNKATRLNIYVQQNSVSLNTCLISNYRSMTGYEMTWTNAISSSGCYYNSSFNIYIYPVANVYEAAKAESLITTYSTAVEETVHVAYENEVDSYTDFTKSLPGVYIPSGSEVYCVTDEDYRMSDVGNNTFIYDEENPRQDVNAQAIPYQYTYFEISYNSATNATEFHMSYPYSFDEIVLRVIRPGLDTSVEPIIDGGSYTDIEKVIDENTYTISIYKKDAGYSVSSIDMSNQSGLREVKFVNPEITNLNYSNCIRLKTANITDYDNINYMTSLFDNCQVLRTSPICGINVYNMSHAYNNCKKMTGSPVCGPVVSDMTNAYANCSLLTGSPVCGQEVDNMACTYYQCYNLTGSPVCGSYVTNMYRTYNGCYNITGSPVCGSRVKDFSLTYYYCENLTGKPVCGNNVTNMYGTYTHCKNLPGPAVCGPNVVNMGAAYYGCDKITGSPVCGNKVQDFSSAYSSSNISGTPVCGPNVTLMQSTYYSCKKLSGAPASGNNVTNMYSAYQACPNIYGTAYWYSPNIVNMDYCFGNRATNRRLNIYVKKNSVTVNTIRNASLNNYQTVTWTNSGTNFYNTKLNIYIYPTL